MVPKLLALSYTLKPVGVTPTANGTDALEKIVGQVIGVLTIVAAIYFAIQVILAGYAFITSEGDPKKMEQARARLTEGVLGLTITVVALGLGALIASLAGIPNIFDLNAMFTKMGL
ncbi:hypothetical protein KBC75_03635 [Candidatus Shapirobacteria bacterium]|nr:hypothetical protein [Candidatus Shapirobacteria bacterium]